MRMRRPLSFLLPILLLISLAPGGVYASAAGRVVVAFESPEAFQQFQRTLAAPQGLRLRPETDLAGAHVFEVPPGSERDQAQRMALVPGVRYAEPETWFTASILPSDSLFSLQWAWTGTFQGRPAPDFGVQEMWNFHRTTGYLIVGVLDSGCDFLHPDLQRNLFRRGLDPVNGRDDDGNGFPDDERGWNFISNNNDPSDDFSHGTQVTGVLAAEGDNGIGTCGVLWRAQVLQVKVLDARGGGSGTGIAAGVRYAVDAGARILNLSLEGPDFSTPLFEALQYARSMGVLVVVSAGNSGSDLSQRPSYPASFDLDNVVAVASVGPQGNLSVFSNRGGRVLLAAPGEALLTTYPGGGYGAVSGTSFSAPMVTGAAALVWAWQPWRSYSDIVDMLGAGIGQDPSLRGTTLTGGCLHFGKLLHTARFDTIPPAPVLDLRTSRVPGSTAILVFTASGEDGRVGRAQAYDVRWGRGIFSEGAYFRAAPFASGPLGPQARPGFAGALDSVQVSGLPGGDSVWVALRVRDRSWQYSALSNPVSLLVPRPPIASLAADTLVLKLPREGSGNKSVALRNSGDVSLEGRLDPPDQDWMSWSLPSLAPKFVVGAGRSILVRVEGDASGLLAGSTYFAHGVIRCNDPVRPTLPLVVRLDVTAGSAPAGSPDSSASEQVGHDRQFAPTSPGVTAVASGWQLRFGKSMTREGAAQILDVQGRVVRRLAVDAQGRASWDGRVQAGTRAPRGVYFARLENQAGPVLRMVWLGS